MGDPSRGAIVFHQPYVLCTKCHATDDSATGQALGPNLSRLTEGRDGTAVAGGTREELDTKLVESLLAPSKVVRPGFEAVVLVLADGRSITGLVAEDRHDVVVLREAQGNGELLEIAKDEIDERVRSKQSIMPSGLVNQLASRQQFLDLVAYLSEIASGGPDRALELKPNESLYAAAPLPEYERSLDHSGLIESWDEQSYERGAAIYKRVCANCHGTHEQAGSLPTSLKFAKDKFKNGSDPYALYQTLTRGFGFMAPQMWMVPRQKYDVIHYLREAYLKEHNPTQYVATDDGYVARLPKGTTLGPEPSKIEPWVAMDYGPSLIYTYELKGDGSDAAPNFAYKGIAARLDGGPGGVSRGNYWSVFDHDTLRVAGAWSRATPEESFIDWNGIQFTGEHGVHPHVAGRIAFANPAGPGWADPDSGSFDDARLRGRDGRAYGPLPRAWSRYRGLYHHGQLCILSYTVGAAEILELPGYEPLVSTSGQVAFSRTLEIGKSPHDLTARLAPRSAAVALVGGAGAKLTRDEHFHLLHIPAEATPVILKVLVADCDPASLDEYRLRSTEPIALEPFTHGGPPRWPQRVATRAMIGDASGPFAVDVLQHPQNNPWLAQVRPTGFDFLSDDRAALCTWDGDVWLVSGLNELNGDLNAEHALSWQRIASGLFQPLGLKVVDGRVFVSCRDQLVALHDLNADRETDFYECINNDHQVTEHFHEFAMGLQTDAQGNFYYAKSARHALPAVVPHHGTLFRIAADGSHTDIVATGFRAANGVCLNPDGTFVVTDQEGHWTPKNRINWVEPGGFYGNMMGYHDVTDTSDAAMQQPLCWITNEFDRSPAELLWVPAECWGPLGGSLLNMSYGYGKIFVVPFETVAGQKQGGMCELPIPQFPTGLIRGRFHPHDGQLYTCGMFSWAGSRTQPGGFYRVRDTGQPLHVPVGLQARKEQIAITFSEPLDPSSVASASHWSVTTWSLERTSKYGSEHHDVQKLTVDGGTLAADGHTVRVRLPNLGPTMGMEIKYSFQSSSGAPVRGVIHNTIHALGD